MMEKMKFMTYSLKERKKNNVLDIQSFDFLPKFNNFFFTLKKKKKKKRKRKEQRKEETNTSNLICNLNQTIYPNQTIYKVIIWSLYKAISVENQNDSTDEWPIEDILPKSNSRQWS